MSQGHELSPIEALAAEHALGVLTGPERAQAEARMASDPAFAVLVEDWRARLAPLAAEVASVEPPARLWPSIERSLPANDNGAVLRRLRFWRSATVGSLGVAAASLAAVVFLAAQPPRIVERAAPAAPMLNASLMGGAAQPMFVAAYDPMRKMLLVTSLVPPGADPGHAHQLWVVTADGRSHSLGMVQPGASKVMPMPEPMAPMMAEGSALMVSVEPPSGSPMPHPTGPVAAKGMLTRI
ncbi:anti-sigma factor [Phenylobacterium deserti]|uniref:Regulator of SigK n=1 Tax=Phenylobacterium deserti TaxID=1914756 RepID=A0A328AAE4_9CAUL|nr:anti-sigma factor [Phenylobacterium deserti]RAK51397.1 hypothetical protein DJ018_15785 [Phenylobacterium deserti]